MSYNNQDKLLNVTKALPTGASSVYTDGIDTQNSANGDFVANMELLIEGPVLAVGELANASTMTYSIEHDTDPAFGSTVTLAAGVLVQTGAGGVGAAASSTRFRLPTTVSRYVRVKATNSAAANASAKSVAVSPCF